MHGPCRYARRLLLLVVLIGTLSWAGSTAPAAESGDGSGEAPSGCDGPITVTEGGTYAGCWSASGVDQPAVTIATSAPDTLARCTIDGRSDLVVAAVPNVKLTVTDCR